MLALARALACAVTIHRVSPDSPPRRLSRPAEPPGDAPALLAHPEFYTNLVALARRLVDPDPAARPSPAAAAALAAALEAPLPSSGADGLDP